MVKQLRRATGTIHIGHIDEAYYDERPDINDREEFFSQYLDYLIPHLTEENGYRAGAFALERGEKTGRVHIQFYVEFMSSSPKRLSTLCREWRLGVPEVFDKVRSAKGAWNYCAGLEDYADKFAFRRHVFGEPVLFGTDSRTNLRDLVALALEGAPLREIMMSDPYAWCIHRGRIVSLWMDLHRPSGFMDGDDSPMKGFENNG